MGAWGSERASRYIESENTAMPRTCKDRLSGPAAITCDRTAVEPPEAAPAAAQSRRWLEAGVAGGAPCQPGAALRSSGAPRPRAAACHRAA